MLRFAALAAFAFVTTPPNATAQSPDTSYAERGPRFLLALADIPVPVDVVRTPVLRQRISLDIHGMPLVEALRLVSEKSGMRLAFSNAVLPTARRIDFRADNITVVAALTEILFDAQVDILFSHDGRGVVVRKPAPPETGTIVGQVTDSKTGQGIAGADIVVEGTKWRATTNAEGRYRVANVSVASYSLLIRRIGYRSERRQVTVTAGQDVRVDVVLEASATTLQEIVVSAQKREERALDVPISVVALTTEALSSRQLTSLDDLQFAVPGLSIWDIGTNRTIQIRGIANLFGNGSLVGVYLDEAAVTLGPANQMNTGLYDLERVEVLRGPQGTLYGEGSAGGTVRFITKSPVLDRFGMNADVRARFTRDGSPSQLINTVINVPLIEHKFGLRVAGTYDHAGGWIDQPGAGEKDINRQNLINVRAKGLWQPSPQFTATAMAEIYRNDHSMGVGEDDAGNFTQSFGLPAVPRVQEDHDVYNVTLSYDFPWARLLSTTSYARATNTAKNFGNYSPILEPPAPLFYAYAPLTLLTDRLFVEEVRLRSSGSGPWQWTTGVFYRHYRDEYDSPLGYFGQAGPPSNPLPDPGASKYNALFNSRSVFADLSYRLADRLTVGAGARYFWDDQEYASGFQSGGGPASLGPTQTGGFHSFDPRLYAQYKLSDKANLYTSVAKGFRSGGFNAVDLPRFGPEHVWTYELGTKMSLPGPRLALDLAVFHTNFNDYVVLGALGAGGFAVFSNAGNARIRGIEWNIGWQPADQWTLSTNGSYLDTRFTKIDATSTVQIVGDPISFVPKYQFTASAEREFKWHRRTGVMRLDYSQQSRIPLTIRSIGPWFSSESDVITLLSYDMRVQWTSKLSVNLFAQNLLNDRGFISADKIEGNAARSRPRTFGFGFGVTY